ncbi:hypothetical protein ACMGD3_24230 [Lysinibacillus sphaericus]|uniref:hypothetical protein n=1 Tax=Lysinibacillus sphaericus TaxID=1421 RepID=UPI003F79AAA6
MSESINWKDKIGKFVYGKKYKTDALNQKKTVQDLLSYDEITENGIVRADDAYFAIIEVSQINSHLLDFNESQGVWFSFRTMLNSINIRHSLILQSRFYDVTDFVKNYETRSKALNNLTPQLEEAREDVLDYYMDFSEERNREQRGYMMFRFNPSYEGLEVGLSTGNAKIDDILTKLKSKSSTVDDEESRSIAISMLEEVSDLAYHLLYTIGCSSVRLNREGVLEYMYSVVNRDLTVHQRFSDALSQGMFNTQKTSQTPGIIVDAIDSILSGDELYTKYYVENQNDYKDEPEPESVTNKALMTERIVESTESENQNEINDSDISILGSESHELEGNFTLPEAKNNAAPIQNEFVTEEIQLAVDTEETLIKEVKNQNVVDIKALVNESESSEKNRKRRAEARKRKKERIRAEKTQAEKVQTQYNGTGSE